MATDPATPRRSAGSPHAPGVRIHQVVATQVAAVLVLIGMAAGGTALIAPAAGATLLLALTWLRPRGRWAFEWLTAGLRFRARRRAAATVLGLAVPGIRLTSADLPGGPAAVLADDFGLTMLLEVGDPAGLLAEARHELPAPWELLPADGRERPPCRVQLLLAGAPAPAAVAASGPVTGSYQMLGANHTLAHARALLTISALRTEDWPDGELRRALIGLVRRVAKRLAAQPLDRAAAIRAIADSTYADPAAGVREEWTVLRAGGLSQVTFHGRTTSGAAPTGELLSRLLQLPVAVTTLALTADLPGPASTDPPLIGLSVRLAAPEPATLEAATTALRRLTADAHLRLRRRDGDHLHGLTATLPLGRSGDPPRAGPGWAASAHPDGSTRNGEGTPARRTGRNDSLVLPTTWAGVAIGRNRLGHPLPIRLFRPAHTEVLLIGGLRCAQLLVFRALAVGARVLVRSHRPREWLPFVRAASVPDGTIALMPSPHPVELPPGSPLRPLLTILDLAAPKASASGPAADRDPEPPDAPPDLGSAPPDVPPGLGSAPPGFPPDRGSAPPGTTLTRTGRTGYGEPWETTVIVRSGLADSDIPAAIRADLVVLQPIRTDEAELIGSALHLGDAGARLARIRPGAVGIVRAHAVRWAELSPTPIEKILIGDPSRSAGER
ncbi:type VII secretion protein EccE [Actinoplanes siamensis]|uniref:Type VII secretion protein EccE n=1 Tax=Actinoplanes siamensis TaxID=1223317 RepID=A0A919N6N4_9ACTN|nr:type VII secretion protein EccE [Actinoplanes siamensis]GIF05279.1 hypothetical protein Asi03nite_28170 [Actinoplanes siamensis]